MMPKLTDADLLDLHQKKNLLPAEGTPSAFDELAHKQAVNAGLIAFIEANPTCAELNIRETSVTDINCLGKLRGSLRSLNMAFVKIKDCDVISDLSQLEKLNLKCTRITSLPDLSSLKHMKKLILDGTLIIDLSPLTAVRTLLDLSLENAYLPEENMQVVGQIATLTSLNLSCTHISDLSPLRDLKSLSTIDLRATRIWDLAPLEELYNLTVIKVDDELEATSASILEYVCEVRIEKEEDLRDAQAEAKTESPEASINLPDFSQLSPVVPKPNFRNDSPSSQEILGPLMANNLAYIKEMLGKANTQVHEQKITSQGIDSGIITLLIQQIAEIGTELNTLHINTVALLPPSSLPVSSPSQSQAMGMAVPLASSLTKVFGFSSSGSVSATDDSLDTETKTAGFTLPHKSRSRSCSSLPVNLNVPYRMASLNK